MKKILFTCFFYITLAIQPSQASVKNWVCDDGSWDDTVCWDPTGQPENSDEVFITQSDDITRTVIYFNPASSANIGSLVIDATGTGEIVFSHVQGNIINDGISFIGRDGAATYNQNGGRHIAGGLFLGTGDTGNGTYNLSSGYLGTDVTQIGSNNGTGVVVFNQFEGAVHQTFTALEVHQNSTYNLFGGSLDNTNSAVVVKGVFNQRGGTNSGENLFSGLQISEGGIYTLSGGTIEYASVNVNNEGVFNQTNGVSRFNSFSDEDGGLVVSGTYDLSAGILESNRIVINEGGTFNFNGGTLSADNFTGNLINNGGTLAPGGSSGTTKINGNYTQTTNGTYEVEIGGLIQGDDYDWLNITGTATLAGTLDVSLLASDSDIFTLGEGDVFDVLFAESITGEFDQLVLTALDGGLKWGVSYITDIGEPDLVRLTINANLLPTADAGFDQVVDEGVIVDLDGSASSDGDGTIDAYSWTQTAGIAVVLSDPAIATPSFVAPVVLTDTVFEFSLQVTDDSGETDTVTVAVTVTDVLVVNAGADQQTTEGSIVRLNGLSSLGVSNNIASYFWQQIAGPEVFLDDNTGAKPGFIAPQVDATQLLEFKLTVTDSNGLQDSDTTFVNVRDELSTSIVPPLDVQLLEVAVLAGDPYQFNTVLDLFGTNDVQWRQISGPTVVLSAPDTATPSFTAPEVSTDSTATFEVRSTNVDGLVIRSFVNINILELTSVNLVPTANAGAPQVVIEGDTVNLDATASMSNDDENIRYYWQQTGGPVVLLSSIIESQPSFVAPAVSAVDDGIVLTFELAVTDASGLVDRQSVTITILDNGITSFTDEVTAVISSSGRPIGIEEVDGGSLVALQVINPNTIADNINRPELLPYGLIDFSLRVEPGSTVEVNFVLPSATSENVTWWKYVNGSGWIDYSANTKLNAARNVLTITLTDNGIGDDDPTPGVIRDPGGLVQLPDPIPDPTPTPPIEENPAEGGGSVGSGGGSFSPLLIALLLLINFVRIISSSRASNRVSNLRH